MSSNAKQAILWVLGAVVFLGIIIGIAVITTPKTGGTTLTANDTKPTTEDWRKGSLDSKAQLIEYSDLQCPACSAYEPNIKRLNEEFGDKIGFTYRHFPLTTIHKNAQNAAWAAEAAGAQGKFWQMHDKLFDMQSDWSSENDPTEKFISYAQGLDLNVDTFKTDFKSPALHSKVQAQSQAGNRAGVNSTPTLFLNGTKLTLPRSYDELKGLVQSALDQ